MKDKKHKKEGLFNRMLDKLIKLPDLKSLDLNIGFLKGFQVKIELFETRKDIAKN